MKFTDKNKNKKNEKNRLHFADFGVTYIDTSVKRAKLRKGGVHRAGEEQQAGGGPVYAADGPGRAAGKPTGPGGHGAPGP